MKTHCFCHCLCLLLIYSVSLIILIPFANLNLSTWVFRLKTWTLVELVTFDCKNVPHGEERADAIRKTSQAIFSANSSAAGGTYDLLLIGDRLLRELRELSAMLNGQQRVNADRLTVLINATQNQSSRLWEVWKWRSFYWSSLVENQEPKTCDKVLHCRVGKKGQSGTFGALAEEAIVCFAVAKENGQTLVLLGWPGDANGLIRISQKCESKGLTHREYTLANLKKPTFPPPKGPNMTGLMEEPSAWYAGIMFMYLTRTTKKLYGEVEGKWKDVRTTHNNKNHLPAVVVGLHVAKVCYLTRINVCLIKLL